MTHRVLIVTGPTTIGGSMVARSGQGLAAAFRRQFDVLRASSAIWLDLGIRSVSAELLAAKALHHRSQKYRNAHYRAAVERYFEKPSYFSAPELTEVVLAAALDAEGLEFRVATFADLADPQRRRELLDDCDCAFVSSTLMRDLSELDPLVRMCKTPHNHVVVGGALASLVHHKWPGHPDVDIVAVGYGELLVPELSRWIKSGFKSIAPPEGGHLVERNGNTIVYSGTPEGASLDWLPTPDWTLAEKYHGRRFKLVQYESVRGCPYRCAFCNFPFLFDDTVFRVKSARRIADDWLAYAAQGVEIVNCLDSLFTIPPRRLRELCQILIDAGTPVRWICYARAGDLAKPGTAELMKRAGALLVHIGYESGSDEILGNMNKRSGVKENIEALRNCREAGLTTAVSLVVGFPGETSETIEMTAESLKKSPPDLFFAGAFNTRMEAMPVLQPQQRSRFGLVTQSDQRSSAPYWRHDTMSCDRIPRLLRELNQKLIDDRVALEGSLFYEGLLGFDPSDREDLLDYQRDVLMGHPLVRAGGGALQQIISACLKVDVRRKLPRPTPARATPGLTQDSAA